MTGDYLILGSLAGVATACWSRLKLLFARIWSIAFVKVKIHCELAQAVQSHCWKTFRQSPFGTRRYMASFHHVRPLKRMQLIAYERLGTDPVLFWNGWRPIMLATCAHAGNGAGMPNDDVITVSFIRGTFDPDRLIIDALDRINDRIGTKSGGRYLVYRMTGRRGERGAQDQGSGIRANNPEPITSDPGDHRLLKWTPEQIGAERPALANPLDLIALPPGAGRMVDAIRRWKDSEAWYREKQIIWTRGWLLYGKPGTGKTSLVRAIAQDLDLPVYVYDLTTMNNRELTEAWREMSANVPCIALFEDLDAVFQKRANVAAPDGDGVSFDCLLNCLSGIESFGGVFKIVTTNNIAKLDEALGVPGNEWRDGMTTRPGRLDDALELAELDEDGRRQIARRILADCPEAIGPTVHAGDGDTGAQFVDRCTRIALANFWNEPAPSEEDANAEICT